jgi:translocation and assembly module TamB
LKLRSPANITVAGGGFGITEACLTDAQGAVLCVAATLAPDGAIDASYSFENVPLGLANTLAPDTMPGQLSGVVQGRGDIKRGADGQWLGQASITSPEARLTLADDIPDAAVAGPETWLLYQNLDLTAKLQGLNATANLTAALQDGGSLEATLEAKNLAAESPGIGGTIDASMPTLAPFAAFLPTIANLDGKVDAKILLGGTVAAPEITGTIDAKGLQADLGQLGIELRNGRLEAEAKRGGGFVLAASVASGKGHLELAGTMSDRGVIDAKILGQEFEASNIPAAHVVLTPDLKLTGDPKAYQLRGNVMIPRALVRLEKLPQDQPPGVSPDVVIVRDGKEVDRAARAEGFPLSATIDVKLGDAIGIQGYGLDAMVAGQLTVRESPGVPTSGSGQLQVSGRYKAYGQDLTIKDGRLLFAGSPLDNPRLAIVAMREIDGSSMHAAGELADRIGPDHEWRIPRNRARSITDRHL